MSRIEKALEEALKHREERQLSPPGNGRPGSGLPDAYDDSVEGEDPGTKHTSSNTGIKFDPVSVSPYLVSINRQDSPYVENYRKIRTSIISKTRENSGTTIMVTSSLMGEGKTITAVNLAVVMARGVDHAVLLVDADLRRPSIHKYLGIDVDKGLSDYLDDESTDISDILIKTAIGKLFILPAGNPKDNPSELLTSMRMQNLVKELKLHHKDWYIIFDTGPLLLSAEASTLGSWMDGVVFVIQEGRTPQKTVMQGFELIKSANLLGVVMNNVNEYSLAGTRLGSYDYTYGYGVKDKKVKGKD